MTYLHQRENIKACPGCGTNLINTAKHCAICGYVFTDADSQALNGEDGAQQPARQSQPRQRARGLAPITINLPVLLGVILLLLAANALVILGFRSRDTMRLQLAAAQATATYVATTYVSPTPAPTATSTPGPPTPTVVVDIEYTVVSGDSCFSIADHFNIYVDAILAKNDIDCANLTIGTVLRIPHPTPTPVPTSTATIKAAP